MHIFDPANAKPVSAGVDHNHKAMGVHGMREKVPWQDFRDIMLQKIQVSFHKIGWDEKAASLTQASLDVLEVEDAEIIAIRLYTGPCFMVYNTTLRAMGNAAAPGVVPVYDSNFGGQQVTGKFTTTLHSINHAVIKLARLSLAKTVYRGLAEMKLPEMFLKPDIDGVRAGVEFAFMSTTADKNVAVSYSKGNDDSAPSTVFTATMSATSRGAYLGWISQYPEEVEFLYSPLCAMQVMKGPSRKAGDTTIYFEMEFATNKTICTPKYDPLPEPEREIATLARSSSTPR
jgi:hypothetical protein